MSVEARDAAKSAAAEAGVPIGDWLSDIIREIAMAERLEAAMPAPSRPQAATTGPRMSSIERAMSRRGDESS